MGRESESGVTGEFFRLIRSYGRRHFTFLVFRFKYLILLFLFVVGLWTVLGESSNQNNFHQKLLEEPKVKEYPDFELKEESSAQHQDRNIQQVIHNKVNKHRKVKSHKSGEDPRLELLKVPSDASPPPQDFTIKQTHRAKHSQRGKSDIVNGVVISNQDPEDFSWDVVGGSDVYRSGHSLEISEEFAPEYARQEPGVGEMGEPVVLYGQEKYRGEQIMKTEAFNLVASDKIVYTRAVPDTRDHRCQSVVYDQSLPTASIVIIFTNEAWSPLIRTIYSVLNRSPPEFVHEIILVDDFSDKKHLGKKT